VAESRSRAFSFSVDYRAALRQLSIAGAGQAGIVVLTVFFMSAHVGA
jgi:hypothetical protein